MKTSIFIPKKINVGYRNREGTYTGKLAYIIYYDEKGVLRKENSWNGWRDKDIPNQEFDNVPTEGFVLNKKVGDCESGWNHRHAYCRVYDPRGFEFEITFENLLYILENVNSIKGKGLEGEFVYGWDGTELILMPTESPDYKENVKFSDILHSNNTIKAQDLIVGATYLTKQNEELVYMGRYDSYRNNTGYNQGKYYWFANPNTSDSWLCFTRLKAIPKNKLIACLDSECSSEYAELYEKMTKCCEFSPIDSAKSQYIPYTFEEFKKHLENDKCTYYADSHCLYTIRKTDVGYLARPPYGTGDSYDWRNRFVFKEKATPWGTFAETMIPLNIEELYERLKPYYKIIYLQNGELYERKCYYGNEE